MKAARLSHGSSRAALLEGAMECLREVGYARTTARDIAAASKANLAGIGYHYGSQEALLIEALGESCRRWVAELGRATRAGVGPTDNRQAMDPLEVFAANRGLCVAFVEALAAAQHSRELRSQLAQIYRDLRSGLADLFNRSDDGGDATARASALLALVDGLMIQWLLDPGDVPSSDRIQRELRALAA
jgi:AcrR family transcriptional regulator